jgi:N-acetylmuramoyl-L-alanine amidase
VALGVALKLGAYIEKYYPDVKVIYTRKTDVFVKLHKRAEIANKANAQLFISIHCNAIDNPKPHGTETWVMGLHKSQANLAVAKKENAVILLEENSDDHYDNFDPNSPESYIIFSLYQSQFRDQSIAFAEKIQNQFKTRVGRFDRGVKEAGFLVLWKTTMPSVLIETGFVSNPNEEKFLLSDQGQDYIASAIYRAFKQYKIEMEGPEVSSPKEDKAVEPKKDEDKPSSTEAKEQNTSQELKEDKRPNPADATSKEAASKKAAVKEEISFGVQFTTSQNKKPSNAKSFQGLEDVWSYYHSGLYKYVSGKYNNLEDAASQLKIVRSKGFSDAFVVAFHNGKRVSPKEAVKLLEEKNRKK